MPKRVLYIPMGLSSQDVLWPLLRVLGQAHDFTTAKADDKPGARACLRADPCDLLLITLTGVWHAPNDEFCLVDDVLEFKRDAALDLSGTSMVVLAPPHLPLTTQDKARLIKQGCSYLQCPIDIDSFHDLLLAWLAR